MAALRLLLLLPLTHVLHWFVVEGSVEATYDNCTPDRDSLMVGESPAEEIRPDSFLFALPDNLGHLIYVIKLGYGCYVIFITNYSLPDYRPILYSNL